MSNNDLKQSQIARLRRKEAGFTLLEAVFAIFILTIGLVGTAAAITYALQLGAISRNVTKSKLLVVASFEEIESLRNSRRLDFKQITNIGNVDNTGSARNFNGFNTGFNAISSEPGFDGVFGTNDDLSISPGPDGVFGTSDDVTDPSFIRDGYSRQIKITNISKSIKKVEIKVRYPGNAGTIGEITGVCYLNDEARLTR
jgi:hypothetical protein